MTRILRDITELRSLEEIYIEGWELIWSPLPESIGNLENLRTLSIKNCGLNHAIPESIGELKNLRKFELCSSWEKSYMMPIFSMNTLSTLPNTIGNLKNLEYLNVANCSFNSLPKTIGNLENLQYFDLRGLWVSSLPESIRNLRKLKRLDLRGTICLKQFPDFIWEMPALEEVLVDNRMLKSIQNGRRINK